MVKFVYFGLICCSVANGLIWYFKEIPDICMLAVLLICVFLILLYRHHTKKWCKNEDEQNHSNDEDIHRDDDNYRDYDVDRPSVFIVSFFVAAVFLLILCLSLILILCLSVPYSEIVSSCAIASLTAVVFFAVASLREARYS